MKKTHPAKDGSLEAPGGFEPPIRVLQTRALPLGYGAEFRQTTAYQNGTSPGAKMRENDQE